MKLRTTMLFLVSAVGLVLSGPVGRARAGEPLTPVQLANDVTFALEDGSSIKVSNESPFPLGGKASPSSIAGRISPDGSVVFPISAIQIASASISALGLTFNVQLIPLSDGVGTIDPITGAMHATHDFKVKISSGLPFFPKDCSIPKLTAVLTTDAPNAVPLDLVSGRVTLVDSRVEIPAVEQCGMYTGIINSKLGLPAGAGKNLITLVLQASTSLTAAPPQQGTSP